MYEHRSEPLLLLNRFLAAGLLLAPVLHRVVHRFHSEQGRAACKDPSRASSLGSRRA